MERAIVSSSFPAPLDDNHAMRSSWASGARLRWALITLALLTTVACAPRPTPGTSTPASATGLGAAADRAGFATGGQLRWESDSDLQRDFDAMAATGARWVRFDVDWPSIQQDGPASFWWAQTDRMVLAARARGMKVLGTVTYTPAWARPPSCTDSMFCGPATPGGIAAYATFAGKAAERYGAHSPVSALAGSVEAWELWNEPNHSQFWQPRPSLDWYNALLGQAYAAIKASDPGATVVTGGTSPAPDAADGTDIAPVTWLTGLYARGAKPSFDAVGHHPYAFGAGTHPLDGQPWNAYTQTQYLYNVMLTNGDGAKKVWGTEAGAPTGTDPQWSTSEAGQTQSLSEYYTGWNTTYAAFTGPLMWHNHRDNGTDPADPEDNFGLLHHDFSPKPAYATLMQLMSTVTSPPPPPPDGSVLLGGGRAIVANPVTGGGYLLSGDGTVTAFGNAPFLGCPKFPWNIARDLVVMPDGYGYMVLDGYGAVHKFGTAASNPAIANLTAPYFGFDIARSLALAPDGRGYAVLDGWGGINSVGSAPHPTTMGYWRGWDIARALVFTPGGGAYLLDGWGGVHSADGASYLGGPYWPGWDIARDLAVTSSGNGYAVLDGFGGIHTAGDAPHPAPTPGWGPPDRWKGLSFMSKAYLVSR
jgi:polysaccharide biosynthesis protein PslG